MVQVVVGEHQQYDPAHPQPVQAAVDRLRVGPGVHYRSLPTAYRQDEGIPLADIAGDHCPPGWGP